MSIDVFGRQLVHADAPRGPPGLGFKLTSDGNFDLENRKLCNVDNATEQDDAVNLKSVKKMINQEAEKIVQELESVVNDKIINIEAEFSRINSKLSDIQEKLQILDSLVNKHDESRTSGRTS